MRNALYMYTIGKSVEQLRGAPIWLKSKLITGKYIILFIECILLHMYFSVILSLAGSIVVVYVQKI